MLKTSGSNNLVKKVFSIEGLVFLVALVALGLSIAAMVKDCKDGFGDTQQVGGCNTQSWVSAREFDERLKITNFCSSCKDPNGMNPNACNPSHCPPSLSTCGGLDPKNCGEGCYYSRQTGTCSYLDYNSLCTDVPGGQSPSPSSQCTLETGDLCENKGCCRTDNDPREPPSPICCHPKGDPGGPKRCQHRSGCKGYTKPPPPPGGPNADCGSGYPSCGQGLTCKENPNVNNDIDPSPYICLPSPSPSPVPPFPPGGFNPKDRKQSDDSHKSLNQVHVMDGDSDNDEVGSSNGPSPPGHKGGLTTVEIVGIVGGGLGLIVVIAIIWYVMKNKKLKPKIA